jgi:DNA polymerase sigma
MALKNIKIDSSYELKAKKLGMSMNEYVGYLIKQVENDRTSAEKIQLDKVEKLESTVQSLVSLRQTDKIALDVMTKRIGTLIDAISMQSQLLESKLAFISKLEQELTK